MKRWLSREVLVSGAIILFLLIFLNVQGGSGMGFPAAWIAVLIVLTVRKNRKRKDDES